jgi:hypothetical protein
MDGRDDCAFPLLPAALLSSGDCSRYSSVGIVTRLQLEYLSNRSIRGGAIDFSFLYRVQTGCGPPHNPLFKLLKPSGNFTYDQVQH